MTTWDEWQAAETTAIADAGRWRTIRSFETTDGITGEYDGQPVVSYASNDYLGLAHHPSVVAAAKDALDRWGAGSTAARLVVGARPIHQQLESALAEWKETEGALLFPTGFATNLGVLSTVCGPDVRVCSDALNHASIVDGCRLSHAEVSIYGHGDLDRLDGFLADAPGRTVIVTDTIFSMDGDVAPLDGIFELAQRHGTLVVLDEAHAVLGPEPYIPDDVPTLRIGTLSKTLGSLGGFVAGTRGWIDLLVNRARPFIFTTASTPADTVAALAALAVLRSDEGADLVARLHGHVERVAPGHPSPIIPLLLGAEEDALAAAAALLERAPRSAIRPPTVPAGTSRLRVALSAAHSDAQITALLHELTDLGLHSAP